MRQHCTESLAAAARLHARLHACAQDVKDFHLLTSYHDQLYAALCFTVINSIEKVLRFSVVDPWMHDKGDGFPLLYVRSHAARLPGSVVRDWLVRCKVMLASSQGRLVLKVGACAHAPRLHARLSRVRRARHSVCMPSALAPRTLRAALTNAQELYSHYSQQVKDTSISMSDPHKAYLLRKAMHFFNTCLKYKAAAAAAEDCPISKPFIQARVRVCARVHVCTCERVQLHSLLPSTCDSHHGSCHVHARRS